MARLDSVVAGDVNVERARMLPEFGSLEDGTSGQSADVVAHIWRGNVDPVELDCMVDDPDTCQFTIDFGDYDGWLANDAEQGVWLIEYQATFSDGTIVTAPATWPDEIYVRADHDPE